MLNPLTSALPQTPLTQCGLCKVQVSLYTCPQCLVMYCSLTCYKSESHARCSERFYEKSVREHQTGSASDDPTVVREILNRFSAPEEPNGWRYEPPLLVKAEAGVEGKEKPLRLSQSEESTAESPPSIPSYPFPEGDEPLTPAEEQELERLLEEADTKKVYDLLTPEQRREFANLLAESRYEIDYD